MDKELENLHSHHVYELIPRKPGMHTLCLGWVLHHKFQNGVFKKNKARLVARGNHQCPGIDYGESFSPVMHLESLHILLAVAALWDLDIIQFDITSAYLHGVLKEDVYMEQPTRYVIPGREDNIWKLLKGLYSLVQAGRTWNDKLDTSMTTDGFTKMTKDPTVYVKGTWHQDDFIAGGFWVNDFIGIGSGAQLKALADRLGDRYGITGLGEVHWILGMKLERDRAARTVSLSQEAFIDSILTCFRLSDAAPVSTPLVPGTCLTAADSLTTPQQKAYMATKPYRELVGALSWLVLGTHPS